MRTGPVAIPVLLTKHEVDFAACARRAMKESNPATKLRWFYNYLQVLDRETRLTGKVNAVICMTDPDAHELRKFAPSVPIYTINTGVDLDYFQPPEQPSEDARLIFVGAFQHLPNVEAMLYFCGEVLPLIRDKMPGSRVADRRKQSTSSHIKPRRHARNSRDRIRARYPPVYGRKLGLCCSPAPRSGNPREDS